jgi:peptidoglycan-associated lipoprotein
VADSATREPVKTGKPLATTEAPEVPMEPEPAAAPAAPSDDDAETRRRLAEQEAEIERLRNAQRAEAARIERQAREQERAQPPVAAQEQSGTASSSSAASQAAAPREGTASSAAPARDEAAAVFPPSASSAEESTADQAAAPGTIPRSIYFDYDRSTIPEKYDEMLLEHAAYLKENPDVKIEVQGNCDERGSREYNLALGSRRAQAVKRALELGGASGKQIRTVSFGSEKPISTGKDEESYSKNRRVDIVY